MSDQRTIQHLLTQLDHAEAEIERKNEIISALVDELYRQRKNPLREVPSGVENWRAA